MSQLMKKTGRIKLFDSAGQRKYLIPAEREKFRDAARKQVPVHTDF